MQKGDVIYRQQAIDALGEAPKYKQRIIKTYAEGRNDQWFDDVTKLTLIPSAQPEGKKGVFIPDITVEMLRKASLEAVDDLLTSGEMKDIVLPSAQPEKTCCGYDEKELIAFAIACRRNEVDEKDLKTFAQDCEFAWRVMQEETYSAIREAFEKYSDISMHQDAEEDEEVIETQVGSLIFRDKVQYGIKEKLKAAYMDGYTAARKECEAERRSE